MAKAELAGLTGIVGYGIGQDFQITDGEAPGMTVDSVYFRQVAALGAQMGARGHPDRQPMASG